MDDVGLYAPGQKWLKREDIMGRAKGVLRYMGMITILLNDYPILKYVLLGTYIRISIYTMNADWYCTGIMGLFVIIGRET